MTIADPISPAFALINSTLRADSTFMGYVSDVYQDIAPAIASTCYCIMQAQSAVDTNTATAVRMLTRLVMVVKIVGPANKSDGTSNGATLRAAFARADALLCPNGQPTRLAGGTLALYRTGVIAYSEVVAGAQWLHLGGLYRAEV